LLLLLALRFFRAVSFDKEMKKNKSNIANVLFLLLSCFFVYFSLQTQQFLLMWVIAVGQAIECFWGCKILILPKSYQICPNLFTFSQISPQFCPNFAFILPKQFLLGDAAVSVSPPALYSTDGGTKTAHETFATLLPKLHNTEHLALYGFL